MYDLSPSCSCHLKISDSCLIDEEVIMNVSIISRRKMREDRNFEVEVLRPIVG